MGYMTAPPALVDLDGDGDVDGVLRRIKDGTGITLSLSNNILTIDTSGGVSQLTDGAPNNNNGENGDVNIDYTNGDIYRKAAGAWSLLETIPSMRRLRMFTAAYNTSTWSSGKFGVYSGKYYFFKTLFPGCASVSDANTYLTNLNFTAGTRFIFQQVDNHDNIAIYRATESEVYIDGEVGYETGTIGADHVGLVLTKESGVTFASETYNVHITEPVNFVFDSSGNATIDADVSIKDMLVTTTDGSSSSTAITTIDTWPIATYRSAKYEYQITDTGASPDEYQTGEIMLLHDGSNSKYNDYGVIFTGSSPLGTFSTDVYSGSCRLRFTAISSNAMAIKVAKKVIKL